MDQWSERNIAELIQLEYKKKNNLNEDSIKDFRDNINHISIFIIGVPEGEKIEKGVKNLFEKIMFKIFSNLGKETDVQVQEEQTVPNTMNPKRTTSKHVIIKMSKVGERILKAAREKNSNYQQIFQQKLCKIEGREWYDILEVL